MNDESPLITFHVLGTLALRGPTGRHLVSPLSGSKRLALLSYLALAKPPGLHRRDTLVALLWPELDAARARNALSNMLYQIRHSLGRDALVASGNDEVGLGEGALWCDALAFEQALDDGFTEEALQLYQGELLKGFFAPDASAEFDHWLQGERERLRCRAADAADSLRDQAERAGSSGEAIRWARRMLAFEPYDEAHARKLISLLDLSGDRAGALRIYESFTTLLAKELGTEPSPETRALIEAVRARTAPRRAAGTRSELSIAVLPFDNLSETQDAGAFTAGLHDDLLTELSNVSALTVIARASVLPYRDTDKSVQEIAGELGVGTLLEGAVQTSGGRLRLNVQLIDASTGAHLWAERYDRELSTDSVFDIQAELVKKIAGSLQAELPRRERAAIGSAKPTADLEAYRLHAQGRRWLDERMESPLRDAADYFRRATEQDPTYVLAWVGLADSLSLLHDYGYESAENVLPGAEEAIHRALELDAGLPEAYTSLGLLRSNRRQGPAAVQAFERAIELRPGYADAHNWLGWTFQCLGRRKKALESAKRAVELNPLSQEAISNLSVTFLANGEADDALREARRVREIEPDWTTGAFYEGLAFYRLGRFDEACSVLRDLSVPWVGSGPRAALALARMRSGDEAATDEMLAELEKAGDSFSVGLIQAARGETERAFDAFGKVADWSEYWPTLSVHLYYPEVFGPLEANPHFKAIVHEVNRSWSIPPS